MELRGPRWKGKGFVDIASANPISTIVAQLQSSLTQSEAHGMISGSDVLLEAGPELADLLDRACFGQQMSNCDKDKQWFQLGLEEAFYLHHALKCLTILGKNGTPISGTELWDYLKLIRKAFPKIYKAYAHLRSKNWVVRSGTQYGVDFMAYRHHPALIHSEYAVLILSKGDGDVDNCRLRMWSDLQGSLRVCGGVAKILLVLSIGITSDASSPLCLEQYAVEERTMTRWIPEESRDDHAKENGRIRKEDD